MSANRRTAIAERSGARSTEPARSSRGVSERLAMKRYPTRGTVSMYCRPVAFSPRALRSAEIAVEVVFLHRSLWPVGIHQVAFGDKRPMPLDKDAERFKCLAGDREGPVFRHQPV